MSECRYIPLEQRAARLIEKGVRGWQEIQRLAMSEEEPVDSIVLLGQRLWLPHHETNGAAYGVTLEIGVHYPEDRRAASEALVERYLAELKARLSDDEGTLQVLVEVR
ncbi:MAG: hypothetical protein ACK47B_11865 [Armatimonadota bacterium]